MMVIINIQLFANLDGLAVDFFKQNLRFAQPLFHALVCDQHTGGTPDKQSEKHNRDPCENLFLMNGTLAGSCHGGCRTRWTAGFVWIV